MVSQLLDIFRFTCAAMPSLLRRLWLGMFILGDEVLLRFLPLLLRFLSPIGAGSDAHFYIALAMLWLPLGSGLVIARDRL